MFVPRVEEYRLPPDEGVSLPSKPGAGDESMAGMSSKPCERSRSRGDTSRAASGGGFNQFSNWGRQQAARVTQEPDLEEEINEVVDMRRREEFNSQRLRAIDEFLPPPSRFKDMIGYALQVSDRKDQINLCLKRTLLLLIFSVIHMSCTLLVVQQILLNLYHIGLSDYFSGTNELQLQSFATLDNDVVTISSPQKIPLVVMGSDSSSVRLRMASSSLNPSAAQSLSFGSSSDVTRGYLKSTYNGDISIYGDNNIHLQTLNGKVYINESTKITGDATITGTIRAKYIDVTNTTWVFDEIAAPENHIANVTVGNLFLTNLYFRSLYLDVTTSTQIVGVNCTPSGGITVSQGATIFAGGVAVTGGLTVSNRGLQIYGGGQTIFGGGLVVANAGQTISNGGLSVDAGGVTVKAGGVLVTGGATILSGGLVMTGGVTLWSGGIAATGGLTVSSDGLRVLSGGVTISTDGIKVTGGASFLSGGLDTRGGLTVSSGGVLVSASGLSIAGGLRVTGGATLESGDLLIKSGDLLVNNDVTVLGVSSLHLTYFSDDVVLQGQLIVSAQQSTIEGIIVDGGGLLVTSGGLTVSDGGLLVTSGGVTVSQGALSVAGGISVDGSLAVSGGLSVASGGLGITGGATINDIGFVVTAGGLLVSSGGGTFLSGGLYIGDSGLVVSGGLTVWSGGLKVTGDGATITAGGLGVTAGGQSIAGGLTVSSGGLSISAGGATVSGGMVVTGGLTGYGTAVYESASGQQASWDTSDRRLKTSLESIEAPIEKVRYPPPRSSQCHLSVSFALCFFFVDLKDPRDVLLLGR